MKDKIGFVFDLDGTLINSTEVFGIIEKEVYNTFNITTTEEQEEKIDKLIYEIMHGENRKNLGRKLLTEIFKILGLSFFQRIKALKLSDKIFKREIKKIKIFDGAKELIDFLEQNDFEFAIATTSSAGEVDDRLTKFPEFYEKFEGRIITRSHVTNLKPHPESIKKASELMGVPLKNIVMVGDMISDIKMGKAVGAVTVGCLTGIFSKERLLKLEPDFVLDSVAAIKDNFQKIVEKVEYNKNRS
ncbi:MAG: HAD-IA family hydrolase [Candidatus Lokiarchaeota archaeon]|nr:HAD-IA family hydrolase [Candidatus Lokiarchaeota archaeon]MBD3343011.1 HAD-IA family hydrolase [Candidatus Lokiarchaeota archaeon]